MKKILAGIIISLLATTVYCELGLLLDDYVPLPYAVEEPAEEPMQAAGTEERPDFEDVHEPEKPDAVNELPQAAAEKQTEEPEAESLQAESIRCEATTANAGQGGEVPPDDRVASVVEIQRAIALQNAKNQLAELEQSNLKLLLESEKLRKELQELQNPAEKPAMTDKPVYIHGTGRSGGGAVDNDFFEEISSFDVMMVSSAAGMRALVRDGSRMFYISKGSRVSLGKVTDITSQGVWVKQEDGDILYPVAH